jgi:hypothetical protein
MGTEQVRSPQRAVLLIVTAVLALFFMICALMVGPTSADAYVYWSNSNGTIGRANLNGSSANQGFITGARSPGGIAVDSQHVYWANGSPASIGRSNLDGSGVDPDFIVGASNPVDVAVDGEFIYWANFSAGTIGRSRLNGTGVDDAFIDVRGLGGSYPSSIAVNSDYIYWSDAQPGLIGRADLDGSSVTPAFIGSYYLAYGVAVNESSIFFGANQASSPQAIHRADIDGTGTAGIIGSGLEGLTRLDVYGSHLYWSNSLNGTISRAGLDGSGIVAGFITGATQPHGVAVDDSATASPSRMRLSFGRPRAVNPGTVSTAQTVKLFNKGGRPLRVEGFRVVGSNPDDFGASLGNCGSPVNPGASCTIKVRFLPRAPGNRSAQLVAVTNSPTDPVISLVGKARDTVAPDTAFLRAPAGRSRDRTPTFRFRSTEPGSSFFCRVNGQPSFSKCSASQTFKLKPGYQVVRVKARDSAGNLDPTAAKRAFLILR